MTKINLIRSAFREVPADQARRTLEGAFAPFGSLEPVASTIASEMVAVVDGDRSSLGSLAEALESVTCDQISHFEYHHHKVVIETPGGTRISLIRGSHSGWYNLRVEFPGGSSYRAEKVAAAFDAAGVEYRQQAA